MGPSGKAQWQRQCHPTHAQASGPQPFRHQGPISWRWGVGDGSGSSASHGAAGEVSLAHPPLTCCAAQFLTGRSAARELGTPGLSHRDLQSCAAPHPTACYPGSPPSHSCQGPSQDQALPPACSVQRQHHRALVLRLHSSPLSGARAANLPCENAHQGNCWGSGPTMPAG